MRFPKLGKVAFGIGVSSVLTMGALALATSLASCSASPNPVPVRTFERAGRMDVVCLKISEGGYAISPIPVAQANCAPVADGTDTTLLPYHLFAVVTQTLRGEVAVVDLTAAHVVDVSRTQPGVNFIPVGANPTDIVATPDGAMVFVASAEVNKPAIYGIPGTKIIGDALGLADGGVAPRIVDLPVCSLPQAPGRIAILPGRPISSDGGVPEAGTDGGASTSSARLAVLLPGDANTSAKLVTIDIASFSDGSIGAGSLAPCKITSAIALSGSVGTRWTAGPTWGTGLPYVDGGVDLFAATPGLTTTQLPLWAIGRTLASPTPDDGGSDASDASADASSDGAIESGSSDAGAASDGESFAIKTVPGNTAHGRGLAFDGRMLFIGDDGLPIIHIVDTANDALTEIEPYVATSLSNPSRIVTTTEIAVSPTTHDFKRYLYALDERDGTIIVYDATDPLTAKRSPMQRPNPELAPAQPPDRIRFAQPVTAFSFVRHDLPLSTYVDSVGQVATLPAQKTGLQCNPNRLVEHGDLNRSLGPFTVDNSATQFTDVTYGANYRANVSQSIALGPQRLRGIFSFVTLSNGFIAVIDVDDWDAACRRPEALTTGFQRSSLQIPQEFGTDFDPYKWGDTSVLVPGGNPVTSDVVVDTNELYFPVSAPNRARFVYFLKDDPLTGKHVPYIVGSLATLLENGAPVDATNRGFPLLFGPVTAYNADPADVIDVKPLERGVRIAREDPTVHVDQDWNITYEGALPGFDGVAGVISSTDFKSISIGNTSSLFCRRGVEDQRVTLSRIAAMKAENLNDGDTLAMPPRIDERAADYVQITDDIMFATDPYWTLTDDKGQPPACWDVPLDGSRNLKTEPASVRQQVCSDKFGLATSASAQRDFPIVEAYDDHLVLGRYLYTDTQARPINGRVIAPPDTESQVDFKLAQCCFHNQAHFRIRTGSQWVAIGSVAGYLHHISADANHACVRSTIPREVLLNARVIERGETSNRNSAFVLRNPIFSAGMKITAPPAEKRFTNSTRDLTWRFSIRGGFTQQGINLASATTAVVPQSMSFIDSIGRLAVVDGSSQGLVLISLDSVAVVGTPYF